MREHKFPAQVRLSQFQLKDFMGVDFTTHESEVASRRSPDAVNVVSGNTGSMDKRLGTKISNAYSWKINSITPISFSYRRYEEYYWYNPSTESYNLQNRYYDVYHERLVVHSGGTIQLGKIVNGEYVHIQEITGLNSSIPISTMTSIPSDTRTQVIRLNPFTYMLTGGGTSIIIDFLRGDNINGFKGGFGLEQDALGSPSWTGTITSGTSPETAPESMASIEAYALDIRYLLMAQSKFKIPTINIACNPTQTSKTPFESRNLLSGFVSETYLGDGTSTIFTTSNRVFIRNTDKDSRGFTIPFYNSTTDACLRIRVRNASGQWVAYSGTYTIVDNLSSNTSTITLSTAPSVPSVTGQDNVEFTYFDTNCWAIYPLDSEWKSVRMLSRLTKFEYFGYNGSFDYAFVCYGYDGDFGKLNKDFRIKLGDNNEDIYMPENGYSYLGDSSSRILGYFRQGNELVTVTEKTNNNPTLFIRNASLDDEGETIFPIRVGVVGIGALSGDTFASLRDDNMWLTEYGISALVTNNITNVQSVQDRGFYINQQLLNEPNLDKAYAFIFDNKYFICVNSKVYIADPRLKYTERLAYSESFQYDWYYWEGLDIQTHAIIDGKLFFGTTDGKLMRYKESGDTYAYCDEITATPTLWANNTAYTVGQIVYTGTNYYKCIKSHTSSSIRVLGDKDYWQKVIKDGSIYQVPVLSYWTTPILNMGNITARKTLKNLWVRLGKHPKMSAIIYYSTQGVVTEQYDGTFDFSDIDFSRFTFSTDTDPSVLVTNQPAKKFMSIQFKVESRDEFPFSLLEIVGEYSTNNKFKG